MAICYLGIGSNLGERSKNIKSAISKISALKDTKVIKISKVIETDPVGGPANQKKFLNAALKIETKFSPALLLEKLKKIETELGRIKTVRNGPRIIDLDILFYGGKIITKKNLTIPHPRMIEREFVIRPLLEVI